MQISLSKLFFQSNSHSRHRVASPETLLCSAILAKALKKRSPPSNRSRQCVKYPQRNENIWGEFSLGESFLLVRTDLWRLINQMGTGTRC